MERKGQAAMEFLMTYGWAILAAIIAIAVLAYFGVFNPGRYTSEMCQVGAPFTCEENSVASTSNVSIFLRNGADKDYQITGISVQNCNTTGSVNVNISSGDTGIVIDPCNPQLGSGTAFRGNIEITYHELNVAGARALTATGSITRKKVIA